MRAPELVRQLKTRFRQPYAWIAVATFGGMSSLLNAALFAHTVPPHAAAQVTLLVGIFMGALGHGFLSPMPWQWTGDDAPECGQLRGWLQAFLFCTAFIAGIRGLDGMLTGTFASPGRHSAFWALPSPLFVLMVPFMVLVGLFINRGERGDRERLMTETELERAKGIMLRSQLSPHSLFNTLNALAELARRDPEATERALLDLSDLYEQMLRMSPLERVTLGEERAFLKRYLDLQAIRLGDRLKLEWDWDPTLDVLRVPPLILQPLAENAIKHGIACSAPGGTLRIRARLGGGILSIAIGNTGLEPGARRAGGTGLKNLEDRLRLAYRGRAAFRLERDGLWTLATLQLPEPS